MAGSGRRVFVPGEVLTASNVMNYLQDQAVMAFAGTAARGSAIGTAVSEGMVSYLQDLNQIQVYDGSVWKQVYPSVANAGEIVQVVSTTKTDTFTASLAAGAETEITGLTATITPTSASNKILILASISYGQPGDDVGTYFTLFRSTTAISQGDSSGSRQTITTGGNGGPIDSDGREAIGSSSVNFLDSPNTTSATTYSVKISHARGATVSVYVNRSQVDSDNNFIGRAVSTITLMEVVA